jgi:hypothetical protein
MKTSMCDGYSIAVLDEIVGSLDGLFQEGEQTFAAIGEGLGDAIGNFATLTTMFETLSTGLENDDMRDAADRLAKISQAVMSMSDALASEHSVLAELLAVNREVSNRLGRLQDSARTMTMLTLNAKIEAARIDRLGEDLSIFSVEMAKTVKSAQETVDAHSLEQADLIRLLSSACAVQAEFAATHREMLALISREMMAGFETVDGRRRDAAIMAAGVGQRSRQIASAVGVAIIALQIGDTTRQRVEHTVDALRMLRSGLKPDASDAAGSELWPIGLGDDDRDEAFRSVCLLQIGQIDGTLEGFEEGLRNIHDALERLTQDCAAIGRQGQRICGASGGVAGSFFGALKEKLEVAKRLMDDCKIAGASVDRAKAAALETLMALRERMAALDKVVNEMTFVGVNAAVKARQFGSEGLGLGVIAEQLRIYAKQIAGDARLLIPSLQRAIDLAQGFEVGGSSADRIAEFDMELSAILDSFENCGTGLDAALAALLLDAEQVSVFLNNSVVRLVPQTAVCAVLRGTGHKLDRIVESLPPPQPTPHSLIPLFQSLWALYTMEGERRIHTHLCELPGAGAAMAISSSEASSLDDILFA